MKSILFVFVIVQVVYVQHCFAQCIRTCGNVLPSSIAVPSTVAVSPSVASSLADTLSLLTVSSLLAETLPFNPNVIATMPVPVAPAVAPVVGGCGCGLGGLAGIGGIAGIGGLGGLGCGSLGCGLGYGYNYMF